MRNFWDFKFLKNYEYNLLKWGANGCMFNKKVEVILNIMLEGKTISKEKFSLNFTTKLEKKCIIHKAP